MSGGGKNTANVEEKQEAMTFRRSCVDFRSLHQNSQETSEVSPCNLRGLRFCRTENSFLFSLVWKPPVSLLHKHVPNGRVRLMDHAKEPYKRKKKDGVKKEN